MAIFNSYVSLPEGNRSWGGGQAVQELPEFLNNEARDGGWNSVHLFLVETDQRKIWVAMFPIGSMVLLYMVT